MQYLLSSIYMAFGIGLLVGVIPQLLRAAGVVWVAVDPGAWQWTGAAMFVLGAAMYFSCGWDFAVRGKGTPAFWKPPRRLVINPWFRLVRNPMYVGVGLMIAAQGVWSGSLALVAYAVAVVLGFHWFVVGYEEPNLRKVFGDSYDEYYRRVPRWIPRLARRTQS